MNLKTIFGRAPFVRMVFSSTVHVPDITIRAYDVSSAVRHFFCVIATYAGDVRLLSLDGMTSHLQCTVIGGILIGMSVKPAAAALPFAYDWSKFPAAWFDITDYLQILISLRHQKPYFKDSNIDYLVKHLMRLNTFLC